MAAQLGDGIFDRPRAAIRPVVRHDIESVCDRYDASFQWNLRALEAEVTRPVPPLVVIERYGHCYLEHGVIETPHEFRSDVNVLPDLFEFFLRQLGRLL